MHIVDPIVFNAETKLKVTTEMVHEVWEKNWYLIVIYVIVQFAWAAISYFTNTWSSVGLSIIGSIVSTCLGLFIAYKVITRTR